MKPASPIIKREYYNESFIIDLDQLSHVRYSDPIFVIYLKNGMTIEICRDENDKTGSLKVVFNDIYTTWKNHLEQLKSEMTMLYGA